MTSVARPRAASVRVNECKVFATTQGADWWLAFRSFNHDRITDVVVSIAGNISDVSCSDDDHARELAAMMVERGLPKSAVAIRRATR